ncbi:hypothetical protein HY251_14820 [bacterium]|nr:hypothetical protein [bacterium]
MRYRTFRAIVLLVVGGLLLSGIAAGVSYQRLREENEREKADERARVHADIQKQREEDERARGVGLGTSTPPLVVETHPPATTSTTPDTGSRDEGTLRSLDRKIIAAVAKPQGTARVKDLFPDEAWKISVYTDAPATLPTRVKIGFDRHRKDAVDEKWELADGTVTKRLVSTHCDGVFDEVWTLEGDSWERREKGASHRDAPEPPEPATERPATQPVQAAKRIPLRDFDRKIVAFFGKPATGDKIKDALGKSGPKVNVTAENGSGSWNHAKVDLNRNEKWDEKWDWKDGRVSRKVAPADDESYTRSFHLDGDAWVEEK